MTQLLVSIIIPTYNRAAIIGKTLKSVSAQIHTNWECLVVDDGSTDNTFEAIEQFTRKDERFKYLQRPAGKPKGANACRNFGLETALGEYVVFFDSDDVMYPYFLEEQLKNLKEVNANYSICNCEWLTISGKVLNGFHGGTIESDDRINDYISFKSFWPIHSVMYVCDFLKINKLYFDESLQQSQEYDFHVRVMQVDDNYAILNNTLVKVIASENSISYSSKNAFAKAYSSLRVRHSFLKNKPLNLKSKTCIYLLHDMHRIFLQQTQAENKKASFYAAYYYLISHFYRREILRKYFLKHVFFVLLSVVAFTISNRGYLFLKKSNTFNYFNL